MKSYSSKLFKTAFLGLILISLSLSTVLATNVWVDVLNPFSDEGGDCKGGQYGCYWVGEIPINLSSSPNMQDAERTRAYCMQYDKTIRINDPPYSASITDVVDNDTWKSISYILTWYDPPSNDDEAVKIQAAIWQILGNGVPTWLPDELNGSDLVAEAFGKDVIRESDRLFLTPEKEVIDDDETVILTANITKSDDKGRKGVKIIFSVDIGSLNKYEGVTDENGEVEVTLTPSGNGIANVTAYTKGVWAQRYLDLDEENRQDLIGFGTTYQLTTFKYLFVFREIFVIPEFAFGTLSAVVMCFLALIVKRKKSV